MKKVVVALALVGLLATPAMAGVVKTYDVSANALLGLGSGAPRGLPSTFGFEPGEGFAVGPIGGQVGWTMFAASLAEGHVDTLNPFAGTQHLRISNDPAIAAGTLTGGFSPDEGPLAAGAYSLSVEIAISATGGADYDVVPQAPSQGFLSARVKFNVLGDILILDDPGLGLAFIDSGTNWTAGAYKNLTIDLDAGANTIDYFYDGALIYSSVAGVFAGTSFEQTVLLSDNFHIGDTGDFDNLNVTPEPATLALIGFGALALIRRRR